MKPIKDSKEKGNVFLKSRILKTKIDLFFSKTNLNFFYIRTKYRLVRLSQFIFLI